MRATMVITAACLLASGAYAFAQNRIEVRPSLVPVGSSSSNGLSFAWFHDPSTRSVYACVVGSSSEVTCKISSLP